MQAIYESVRAEAWQNLEPASWARERVRHYGVAGLFPGSAADFPFIVYAQSVARPAWSGKRDFHRERLRQAYELLTNIEPALDQTVSDNELCLYSLPSATGRELLPFTQELSEDARRYLRPSLY